MPFNPTLRSSQSTPLTFGQMDNNFSGIAEVANAAQAGSNGLAYASGVVTIVGSGAPSVGWTLQATSPTTAVWAAPGAGAGTVTSVQGTNANGISWTISNPTSTPNLTIALGAITPTSVNGVTISSGGTLNLSGGSLIGTGTTVATLPPGTVDIGYLNVPSNPQIANYTTVYGDAGKAIDHPASDNVARTFTIDGSVAYEVGTCITFTNLAAAVLSIAIGTDVMYLAGLGTTGTRSLAQFGEATARKTIAGYWIISGSGLT